MFNVTDVRSVGAVSRSQAHCSLTFTCIQDGRDICVSFVAGPSDKSRSCALTCYDMITSVTMSAPSAAKHSSVKVSLHLFSSVKIRHVILSLISYCSLTLWKVHHNSKFWSLPLDAKPVVILTFLHCTKCCRGSAFTFCHLFCHCSVTCLHNTLHKMCDI